MGTPAIVTMTTDFGIQGHYVGAMKGALLSVNPYVQIVDINHEVTSHDLLHGAFTLQCAYSYYPSQTVHLVVVDPGVGSERRGLILISENYFFVAPDNGVLSLVARQEKIIKSISIESDRYFRRPVSSTFHGRDIFAPVAGWLARGVDADEFGPRVDDIVHLNLPPVRPLEAGLEGEVLHIDKFGNIITNLRPEQMAGALEGRQVRFVLNGREVKQVVESYAEAGQDEIVALVGSSQYYEIAAREKSAAVLLGAKRGMKVELRF